MTTISQTYPAESAARRAVDALRTTGTPDRRVRLVTGRAPRNVRREPVGGFAGPVGFDALVGTFGPRAVLRRQATGGFAGAPDARRQGSFADTDRVVIVTYEDDAEDMRVTGLRGVRRLLDGLALDPGAVDRAVRELDAGHALVLVDLAEGQRVEVAHAA
jgi:hypothetical protein